MELTDEEYQAEYDKAAAELDAAEQSTTARGSDGKFKKAEEAKPVEEKPAEAATDKEAPKQEETKPEATDKPQDDDELTKLRKRFEAQEKALKDTQAWATKLSQERAAEKREREERERQANKPAILDLNPELESAIKYVRPDPPPQQADPKEAWIATIDRAHPGIFSTAIDETLQTELATRIQAMPDEERADPLAVIREISEGKLEFERKKLERQQAANTAKAREKAAMSIPGAGAGGSRTAVDPDSEAVSRVHSMSDADFEREYRKARGF